MIVVWFLLGTLGAVILVQNAALLVLGQPLQLAIDPGVGCSKPVRLALKLLLQGTLVAALALYPAFARGSFGSYYGPMLRAADRHLAWQGWLFAAGLLAFVLLLEACAGCFEFGLTCPRERLLRRIAMRIVSCVTVVAVEEPFFRGILLKGLLTWMPVAPAIALSAAIFSAAHFLRRHEETWASVGLFVLGVQLGVAFVATGSLWLPMGLHSGGVLVIQLHRLFVARYRGPRWLIGTQVFPIAGATCITLMAATAWGIWRLLG
jgi:membrane protease YdiL (CAAX protease family)